MPRSKLPRTKVKKSTGQGCLVAIVLVVGSILFFVSRGIQPTETTTATSQTLASRSSTGPQVVLSTREALVIATATTVQLVATPLLPVATPTEVSSPDQAESTAETSGVWGVVTAPVLNIRESPSTSAPIVGTLQAGECVELVTEGEGWYGVATATIGGWSSSDFITLVTVCPTAAKAPIADAAPTEDANIESAPATNVQPVVDNAIPSYVGLPFVPNATVARDGWFYECFGQGDNGLRVVSAGTPVQLLGVGEFVPTAEQQSMMGSGPFYKIRIWDGQYGWLPSSVMDADPLAYPVVSGGCAEYDTIDWTTVVHEEPTAVPVPTWTQVVATPTSPSWTPNTNPSPSSGCCKICTTGKACGNSCISRSYTCHKGPGCACNG